MNPLGPAQRAVELGLKWPRYLYRETRKDGIDGMRNVMRWTGKTAVEEVSRWGVRNVHNPGTPIWEADWEVLVIMDACRVDLLEEVVDSGTDHGVVTSADSVGTFTSLGSKSSDWLRRNFTESYRDEIERTAYVTGNPFTAKAGLDDDTAIIQEAKKTGNMDIVERNVARTGRPNLGVEPAILDEVWKTDWDDDISTIPARQITDRAIATWRDRPAHVDRMVIHYMQPHGPFVEDPELGEYGDADDFGTGFGNLWYQAGDTISVDRIWEAYRDNLEYVLEDVAILLENLDADHVVLSADHGNAVGEFDVYGHPWDVVLPEIRRVPWIETSATDTEQYVPDVEPATEATDSDIEDRLADLGYM